MMAKGNNGPTRKQKFKETNLSTLLIICQAEE